MTLNFIFISGVWVLVTLMPTLLLQTKTKDQPLQWTDYLGWTLWTAGFIIETMADYQKAAFRHEPANEVSFHPQCVKLHQVRSGMGTYSGAARRRVHLATVLVRPPSGHRPGKRQARYSS